MRNQKGAIMVMSGSALGVGLLLMSLTFDGGYIFMVQSELQNAADASALAGLVQVPVIESHARPISKSIALQNLAGGKPVTVPDSDILFGQYDFTSGIFTPSAVPINASQVTASRTSNVASGNLELFFARMLGRNQIGLQKPATAALDYRVVGVRGNQHLVPFAIYKPYVDVDSDGNYDIGNNVSLPVQKLNAGGNFGYLDFTGGGGGTSEIRDDILYGLGQDFVIPPQGWIDVAGEPGILGDSLTDAFQQTYNEISYFPVYTSMSGGDGSNATYHVVGIVAIKVAQVALTGNQSNRQVNGQIVTSVSSDFIVRDGAPANNSLVKLRLVK